MVKVIVEGDMNLYGILGVDFFVWNGFNVICVIFEVDVDVSKDDIVVFVV